MTDPETNDLTEDLNTLVEEDYHSHPALSQSGAKVILQEGGPAKYRQMMDFPRESKDDFDFGHAAHREVLSAGMDIVEVKHPDWRTNDAKAQRKAIRADRQVPVLTKHLAQVREMAAVIRDHPMASQLLIGGVAEQRITWTDGATGVQLRAMIDCQTITDRAVILSDYKSTTSAVMRQFSSSAFDFGYTMQDAWYREGARATGVTDDPAFFFIAQEKSAPYLVRTFELDEQAQKIGRIQMRRAIELFAQCTAAGDWPGYPTRIESLSVPAWAAAKFDLEGDPAA